LTALGCLGNMDGKRVGIMALGIVLVILGVIAAAGLNPGWLRLTGVVLIACGLWLGRRTVKAPT